MGAVWNATGAIHWFGLPLGYERAVQLFPGSEAPFPSISSIMGVRTQILDIHEQDEGLETPVIAVTGTVSSG